MLVWEVAKKRPNDGKIVIDLELYRLLPKIFPRNVTNIGQRPAKLYTLFIIDDCSQKYIL
jgi:hypothetical protein